MHEGLGSKEKVCHFLTLFEGEEGPVFNVLQKIKYKQMEEYTHKLALWGGCGEEVLIKLCRTSREEAFFGR